MGIFKNITSRILDEVCAYSPTLNEMRWDSMLRDYEREKEKESYATSSSKPKTTSKKTTSKKSTTSVNRGTQKKKITIPNESEMINLSQFEKFVKDSCSKLRNKYSNVFEENKKLENKLNIPSSVEIYLEHDGSLTKNGGCGFAVTSIGIYSKEDFGAAKFVSYEELSIYKMAHISYTSYVNNKMVLYMMKDDTARNALIRMYNKIGNEYLKVK